MKGKGTVKIDISDLDKYIRGARDLAPNPVTDWMALKSQLQVNGLKVSVRGTRPCYLIHSSLTFQGRRSSMRLAL